jgi:hypothetical protein
MLIMPRSRNRPASAYIVRSAHERPVEIEERGSSEHPIQPRSTPVAEPPRSRSVPRAVPLGTRFSARNATAEEIGRDWPRCQVTSGSVGAEVEHLPAP